MNQAPHWLNECVFAETEGRMEGKKIQIDNKTSAVGALIAQQDRKKR